MLIKIFAGLALHPPLYRTSPCTWSRLYPIQGKLHTYREHYALSRQSARAVLSGLLWQGRLSPLIGCSFVTTCIVLADFFCSQGAGPTTTTFREGLTIIGWVVLWRPVQIFQYAWWSVWRCGHVLTSLKHMRSELLVNNVSITHQGRRVPDT